MSRYEVGEVLAEGKTKIIRAVLKNPGVVAIESKDAISAGNGRRRDVIPGKGILANEIACNTMAYLRRRGVRTAFQERIDERSFLATACRMITLEVVVRYSAFGSYVQRNPFVKPVTLLEEPIIEFFLKTTGGRWKDRTFPVDDPLLVEDDESIVAHRPDVPVSLSTDLGTVEIFHAAERGETLSLLESEALAIAEILHDAWKQVGCRLIDVKLEFGWDQNDQLLLADVVDNEASRVLDTDGKHVDKEPYRRDCSIEEIMEIFRRAKALSDRFKEII